ncbi:hypothetical protein HOG21_02975 [bacterium]|jgi:hypothetical protein|nr:hypothetical protein [bacterium]
MSPAVTAQEVDLVNFNQVSQISPFDTISHFKFNIISIILSFTQGNVEYS